MDDAQFKLSHAPAVKVGGVRVKPHKIHSTERVKNVSESNEFEDLNGQNNAQIVSGVVTKVDLDFPSEAIKSYHEKPLKTLNLLRNDVKSHYIHQPRKQ